MPIFYRIEGPPNACTCCCEAVERTNKQRSGDAAETAFARQPLLRLQRLGTDSSGSPKVTSSVAEPGAAATVWQQHLTCRDINSDAHTTPHLLARPVCICQDGKATVWKVPGLSCLTGSRSAAAALGSLGTGGAGNFLHMACFWDQRQLAV